MDVLQVVRDGLGRPMVVTSGFRCPAHNAAVGGTSVSMHLAGRAADIATSASLAHELVRVASSKMAGLGIAVTFIHLDNRDGVPVLWTY